MINQEELGQFPRFKKLHGQHLLGIDYGSKVIGLATFCPGRDPAPAPYDRIIVKSIKDSMQNIHRVIDDEIIDGLVFGLPLYADKTLSPMAKEVQTFAQQLSTSIEDIKIYFQDETLTSYKAEERMKSSAAYNFQVDPKRIDSLSAAIILEDFIKSTEKIKKL